MKKKPICLMSGWNLGLNSSNADSAIKNFQARREIMNDNGLELKLLIPHKRFWKNMDYALGFRLYETMPEAVVQLDEEDPEYKEESIRYLRNISWPRDIFQKVKEKALVFPFNIIYTPQILNDLGKPIEKKRISCYGIGGLSVGARNLRIVAKSRRLNARLEDLEWMGEKPYIMPSPYSPSKEKRGEISKDLMTRMSNRHMDTEIGFAENSSGDAVLLVSPEYHETYKREVIELAKKLDAKPYVCKGERMAMNLITLPNKKSILPKKYQDTIKFLRETLGKESVIPIETLPREINSSGGLRCRTNIID